MSAASRREGGPERCLPASLAANPVLSDWIDFAADGAVTVRSGKVEYGQGVWTALAQVAAEELDVTLGRIRVAPVSTSSSPDEGFTAGSKSFEDSGAALRQACAQARAAFLAAAAARQGGEVTGLTVDAGAIRTAAGLTGLTYWSLNEPGLLDRPAGDPVPGKQPGQWSVAGHSAPRLDIPDKVTGRPRFLHDLVLPGMLFGRVVRPPGPAATLDHLAAADLPAGVLARVHDGSFLGVIAESDGAALRAAGALAQAARWTERESLPDENDLKTFLTAAPAHVQTVIERRDEKAAARVSQRRSADFTRPFIAHASMAPSCAIARWDGGKVTVWTHSQGIFAQRGALAEGLGLPDGQVTVHHVEGAGAYGHNGADDVAADAVRLARAVPGRPVRVMWTRPDELAWAPFGSAMLARLSAGLDTGGRIQTWRQDVWSNGFVGRPGTGGDGDRAGW